MGEKMTKPTKVTRIVRNDDERLKHMSYLASRSLPYTATEEDGEKVKRSTPQNSLQHKWLTEATQQGDMTYEEYRGFCKLHFGVPILREDDDEYRKEYDEKVKQLSYEIKTMMMVHPINASVTRDMNKGQMDRYLAAMHDHFVGNCGFVLTEPSKDMFYE